MLNLSVGMTKKKTIAVGLCAAIMVGCFTHIMVVTERQANEMRETLKTAAKDAINGVKKEYEERQNYVNQHEGTQSTSTTKKKDAGKKRTL